MPAIEERLALELLGLPASSRATLALKLIESLDEEQDDNAEQLCLAEAERRLAEVRSGETVTKAAEDVFSDARSRLE